MKDFSDADVVVSDLEKSEAPFKTIKGKILEISFVNIDLLTKIIRY